MDIRMEYTAGLGKEAEVWVEGRLMTVCDAVSTPQRRCPVGELAGARFQYTAMAGFTWEQAVRENLSRRKEINHVRRWSYTGFGQVTQIMPVTIDFGLLRMEDANWTTDENLVGQFVMIPVDRLEIAWIPPDDWPDFGG